MNKILTLIIAICIALSLNGQNNKFKDERRTYLLDCTLSMDGYNGSPKIMQQVKDAIIEDIKTITNPRTEIVVVRFLDAAHPVHTGCWREFATEKGKAAIISKIKSVEAGPEVTNTDIATPLRYVIDNIFTPDKIDILKLLTDGKTQNYSALQREFALWCDMAVAKDVYGFYIMLTEAAKSQELVQDLNKRCRFEAIDGIKVDMVSIFAQNRVSVNFRDSDYQKPITVKMTHCDGHAIPAGFKVRVQSYDNPFVKIDEVAEVVNDQITLHPKFLQNQSALKENVAEPSQTVQLGISSASKDDHPYVFILNDAIELVLVNRPEKTLRFYVK